MPYAKSFPTAKEEHDYQQQDDSSYKCKNCDHTIKSLTKNGVCIGIPIIYSWDDVPDSMGTKTKLSKELGLRVCKDQLPVAAKYRYDRKGKFAGYYALYSVNDATPKKKPTQAQLDALAKARFMAEKINIYCSICGDYIEAGRYGWMSVTRKEYEGKREYYDRYTCWYCDNQLEAASWAKAVLEDDTVIILDTETTDLKGEIIELAIIDNQGNVLFNKRIKPQGKMNPKAQAIHGISLDDLKDAQTFPELYNELKAIIEGKRLITYNLNFDWSMLCRAFITYELPTFEPKDSDCAMEWFAQWYGDYSSHYDSYKWQPLHGGDHTALGDCRATLQAIQRMAKNDG